MSVEQKMLSIAYAMQKRNKQKEAKKEEKPKENDKKEPIIAKK
jgi:hypothetical protein